MTDRGERAAMGSSKGSIWTPANIVTCVRIVLVPAWLLLAELTAADAHVPGASVDPDAFSVGALATFIVFAALSLTDKLDGYLARSRNEVTTFGKFLDPIADKLVVVVSLCYLLEVDMVSSWVLLIIVAREFLVSGLRMVVASKGEVVAASNLGKAKTATTMVSIAGILLVLALPQHAFTQGLLVVCNLLLAVAVVLTVWSGVDYFIKCWPYISEED